jgi:hypothetical protein
VTAYAADPDTGAPLCADCAVAACRSVAGFLCDAQWCQCLCVSDRDRARELDDRDPDKLAVVAAELAAERIGPLRDLTAERFGGGDRG